MNLVGLLLGRRKLDSIRSIYIHSSGRIIHTGFFLNNKVDKQSDLKAVDGYFRYFGEDGHPSLKYDDNSVGLCKYHRSRKHPDHHIHRFSDAHFEIPTVLQTMSNSFGHLLPPSWKSQVTAWLAEDTPSFDYGGYVVGEAHREAFLFGKGKDTAVLAGSPFFTEVFAQIGCE